MVVALILAGQGTTTQTIIKKKYIVRSLPLLSGLMIRQKKKKKKKEKRNI